MSSGEPLRCRECGQRVRPTAGRDDTECGVSYHVIGTGLEIVCASCVLTALRALKLLRETHRLAANVPNRARS